MVKAAGASPTVDIPSLAGWIYALGLGQWEPGELRGSRRVLREPGGEIPPGYSPVAAGTDSWHVFLSVYDHGHLQP